LCIILRVCTGSALDGVAAAGADASIDRVEAVSDFMRAFFSDAVESMVATPPSLPRGIRRSDNAIFDDVMCPNTAAVEVTKPWARILRKVANIPTGAKLGQCPSIKLPPLSAKLKTPRFWARRLAPICAVLLVFLSGQNCR
jgi:hypothetical protein